jgi:hypothetical protein
LEHDISYRLGRDPRHAYFKFRGGAVDPFEVADPITRMEADHRFRRCLCNRSAFGKYSPMAWWRWAGVRCFGWIPWSQHRLFDDATGV